MKRPIVFSTLSHAGRKYYRCLKGNGSGGCKEKVEITEETFNHLIKYSDARDITSDHIK